MNSRPSLSANWARGYVPGCSISRSMNCGRDRLRTTRSACCSPFASVDGVTRWPTKSYATKAVSLRMSDSRPCSKQHAASGLSGPRIGTSATPSTACSTSTPALSPGNSGRTTKMSATGNLDQRHRQVLFENRARVRFPEKIEQALAKPEVFSQVTNVPQLATLVRGALVARDKVNAAPLADLVQLSLDTMLIVGAGPGFTEYDEFFASALQLVDEVEAREYPVSQLLLSAARFQALLATGDARRRQLIERAVTTSQGPAERLPALLTLAKFWIDVSKYPAARRALAECEELLANGTHTQFEADFETTVGVSYFYTEPDTAQKHFQESVRLGRRRTHEPGIGQAVTTALHFLGRLAANRGDYRHAIELYTEAEELSDDYLTGHGFYHQRIAEILVDHGRLDEARYHLERGSEAFAKIQQVSIGLALLDGVWARLYNRQGELVKAEETLRKALHLSRAHN